MIALFVTMNMLYLLFMLVLNVAWRLIKTQNTTTDWVENVQVSVIVPVRDEQENIQKLLDQLMKQDSPKEFFEIIVVNDHSTDGTVAKVEAIMERGVDNLHLIHLEDSENGKKTGLTRGIDKAKGEIIVTTDGDCEVGTQWLKSITSRFDQGVMMVFGPVGMRARNFFEKMQMIDFTALIGVGAATWRLGMASMCNGANLAFRKDVFLECNGYEGTEQHPSGDDEFLLRKIHQRYPRGIKFLKNNEAMVYTEAQLDFSSFVNQRKRWAGKWKVHKDVSTKLIALFVFFYYALLIIATVWSIAINENIHIILSAWILKWLLDVLFVQGVLNLNNQRLPLIASLVLSLLYPFYAIGIGISSINYTFEWKGRKY